jgi:tetratricopeptide (TPR) repeat protein
MKRDTCWISTMLVAFVVAVEVACAARAQTLWERSMDAGERANVDGRYHEAERQYLIALSEARNFGHDDDRLAISLYQLSVLYIRQARYYRAQDKYAEAQRLARESLSIREQVYGSEHPRVALVLNILAAALLEYGSYSEAKPLLNRALEINEKALGAEHPNVGANLLNLAKLDRLRDSYAEVAPRLQRALIISQKHPQGRLGVADTYLEQAKLSVAELRYVDADKHYKQSLALRESILGREHPEVVLTLEDYAVVLQKTSRDAEAVKVESRAKTIRANHERTDRVE